VVRPPGFEPGFLPYRCRSEAVRLALAGLRRADPRVPVLDQTVPTLLPSRALFGSLRKVRGRLDYGRTKPTEPLSTAKALLLRGLSRRLRSLFSRASWIFSAAGSSMGIWADTLRMRFYISDSTSSSRGPPLTQERNSRFQSLLRRCPL